MKRAIHFFPELPLAVSDFRIIHDPLGMKIPPHITLVFPFEDEMFEGEMEHHVETCVETVGAINFTLGQAEIGNDDAIWLPVIRGKEEIVALYDSLYTGRLRRHRSTGHDYVPHLTVARASSAFIPRVHAEARVIPDGLHGVLERVVVERIAPDDTSEVLFTVALAGNRTNRER